MEDKQTKYYTLITGASAGIGKQLAFECARKGYNLLLVSLPETGLDKLSEEIKEKYSIDVKYVDIDLTKTEAPQKVFDFTRAKNLEVNILANNAGLGFNGKFENLTINLVDQMILLNIRASTLLTLLFLPGMKKLEKAYILNISSFGAFVPLPYKCVYAATKTYLLFLSQAINHELKGTNVQVTSVHPSGVSSERAIENIQKSSLMARISTLSPEDVAHLAIKNMLSGKKIVVPGLVTKFYYFLGLILPHGVVLRLVGHVFRKTT
jgi:short-subunit dehydrogenase